MQIKLKLKLKLHLYHLDVIVGCCSRGKFSWFWCRKVPFIHISCLLIYVRVRERRQRQPWFLKCDNGMHYSSFRVAYNIAVSPVREEVSYLFTTTCSYKYVWFVPVHTETVYLKISNSTKYPGCTGTLYLFFPSVWRLEYKRYNYTSRPRFLNLLKHMGPPIVKDQSWTNIRWITSFLTLTGFISHELLSRWYD